MLKFCCNLPNCNQRFATDRGLFQHKVKDPLHNRKKSYDSYNKVGKKRHFPIQYECNQNTESNLSKKPSTGPRYIDADIMSNIVEEDDKSSYEEQEEIGNDDVDADDVDDDDEEEEMEEEIDDDDDDDEEEIEEEIEEEEVEENEEIAEEEEQQDISDTIQNVNPELLRKYNLDYIKFQHKLYSEIFGIKALQSENIQEFKDNLANFENKKILILRIYLLAKSANMSRNNGDDFLELINDIMKYGYSNSEVPKLIPNSWKSITRFINQQTSFYTCEKTTIPFPEHWEMNKWNCNNAPPPEEVEIRIRDPMELIADQCVNPIIHFLWKEHVHINYHIKRNSNNEDVYCDIMSSEWARKTLEDIQIFDPNGLLLPIILYADGVSIGMNGKANVTPVMMTLGWYSKELFKQDYGKMVIGYIDKLANISEEELIKHLMTVKGFNRTWSEENVKWFKKKIFYTFWGNVLEKIKSAANSGILVKILGIKEPQAIYPRIAFHAGDDPAQHEVVGIKCGATVKHGCIRCMYNFREGGQYKHNIHKFREMSIVPNIRECGEIFEKVLQQGGKWDANEKQIVDALGEKGYHPIINPFFNAPFGVDNHIYNTPVDLMHTFLCGIIKSVLQWTLTIILEIRHHVEKNRSTPYNNNKGLFDQRLRTFPTVPDVPHLYWNTFKSGLTYIQQKKSTKEKSNATGGGGGFRSSDYLPALIQTLFAVSNYFHYPL